MSKTKLREFAARQQQAITDSALLPCEISYLLYQADVLNTGCQQNPEMENEYDQLAQWIHDGVAAAGSQQAAVRSALTDLFDADIAADKTNTVLAVLQSNAAKELKSSRQQRIDALHLKLFPECYDHLYDSIEDARIRRRGQDPMSLAYQAAWQQKRRERGISEEMMNPETEAYAAKTYAAANWVQVIK
jgi:signal transduction histidine kinase